MSRILITSALPILIRYGHGLLIFRCSLLIIFLVELFSGKAIKIKSDLGTLGHSDGDPILHAVTDGILGACNLGDIGTKFPDTSKKYKNIRSTILLKEVINDIKKMNKITHNIEK